MNKTKKSYNVSPENSEWLTNLAALETVKRGRYVSASKFLDELLTERREHDERMTKGLEKLLNEVRRSRKESVPA